MIFLIKLQAFFAFNTEAAGINHLLPLFKPLIRRK